jgi:hypothetical protein
MPGPGEYRPDPSEGIIRIEDLPKPKIRCQSRNYRRQPCLPARSIAATASETGLASDDCVKRACRPHPGGDSPTVGRVEAMSPR